MKDRARNGIGAAEVKESWALINWRLARKRIKNLRQRIYRATRSCQWNQVRSLTKLMLRSRANLLLSIKRVTQENRGKSTAGIDGKTALDPRTRMQLAHKMSSCTTWKSHPARRIYIPKRDGKKRPLGIPIIENRVAQAVVKNALEPIWEAKFEANSYGFRPGRSCHDAIAHCWINLNRRGQHKWVLDADITGAFDNISHAHILESARHFPGRELVKQWLKAGYVDGGSFFATPKGTPQGGVISPLLANIALDGLQNILVGKVGFIRYADDFVITARTREEIETNLIIIKDWLATRGLEMNPSKTSIRSMDDGFNFLGFNLRHYRKTCLIMPQKEKVLEFLRSIREWLKNHKQASPASVIGYLNPRIVGWSNYYKGVVSKETFSYVKSQIWQQLWRWCLRRHSTKKRTWVKKKYFIAQRGKDWIFHSYTTLSNGNRKLICLRDMSETPIQRHIKVKGKASPDDAQLQLYWEKRKYAKTFAELKSWRLDLMASKQDWRCPQCSEFLAADFSRSDSGQVSFVPIRRTKENVLVHSECAGTLERNMET